MGTKTDLERWAPIAQESVQSDELGPVNVPLHVIFGEAVDVAAFFEKYWLNTWKDGRVARLGLESAVGKTPKGRAPKLGANTGKELLSLQRAAQQAQFQYITVVGAGPEASPLDRGLFLLNEIVSALEWYFDDGVEDENDAKLAQVDAAHEDDPETADAVASALDDYAMLAAPHREALDGLAGFQSAYIDEAGVVAAQLRARPTGPVMPSDEARAAIVLRNKVVTLLWQKMSAVRGAARYVFRAQPAIVREATSAYERRRRASARRAKAKKVEPPKPA